MSGDVAERSGHDIGPCRAGDDIVIPDLVDWEDGLSEDEAVALGLWHNPNYQELLADLQITHADITAAAQLANPSFSTMFPAGPKQWEFALSVPLDVLWLRPVRVAAAELESHRVGERLVQDGLNTVRDIRVAFVDWETVIERAEIVAEMAKLRTEVARVAKARLDAGESSELDVAAMRLDAAVGDGDAIRARREVAIAEERLRYLLGLQMSDVPLRSRTRESSDPRAVGSLTTPATMNVDELTLEATNTRPDLRAIQLAVGAAEERAELARRDIWQVIGIFPDINARGRKGFEAGPGLQMTVPIFHQNQGAIERAFADAERLRRQYRNRRDLAAMEVRQAYARLQQAEQDLSIWRETVVPKARDAVKIAQAALKEDAVQLLLVLETNRQLLAAQQRELDAQAQLRRSVAELERSVGRRLFDYAGGTPINVEVEAIPAPPLNSPDAMPPLPRAIPRP